MNTIEVTFKLPEALVTRARNAGKLTTEYMIGLLEKDLEREFRVNRLFATLDRIQTVEPPITEAEINEELAISRQEKHGNSSLHIQSRES